MQRLLVDEPARYQIVSKTSSWTKSGELMIAIDYIERDAETGDKY